MTIVGYRAFQFIYQETLKDSLNDWTICVFKNFQGDDKTWIKACGVKPKTRISTSAASWFLCVISGHSIFITAIFLPAVRQSITLWGKNLFQKFRIFVRRSTGNKLSFYWGSYYSSRRNQLRAKLVSWRSRRVTPDYPTGPTRTHKLDKRSESENMRIKESACDKSNKSHRNNNNINNNNNNNNINKDNINNNNQIVTSCLEAVPTEEMLKYLQLGEQKMLDDMNNGDKNENSLMKKEKENLITNNSKMKDKETEKEKEKEKEIDKNNDKILGKKDSFTSSDFISGFSLRRLSLGSSISRIKSVSSNNSSHNKSDLMPHSADDERYFDNMSVFRNKNKDNHNHYHNDNDTNDSSANLDYDSNSDKTEADRRMFTITNSEYIKNKLNEEENENSIHENSQITVISPTKIIPPITESLQVQISIKHETIITPEKTKKIIDKIPFPPPVNGTEKSPKKKLAEKNTMIITNDKNENIRITEKNIIEDPSKRGKSVRFEKSDEVKIVNRRNEGGSFCDVETSAGVLNDIKPSKLSRFRLPEWT
jgi:hypothetical protein